MTYSVEKSDAEWRAELTSAEYSVLRGGSDEAPFTGEYVDTEVKGVYSCRACGAEVFTSEEKFDSRCGWPSFFDPKNLDSVRVESSYGQAPVVRCARCGSYLGELFEGEGFTTPTDKRYCINSLSLRLKPADTD